MMQNMAPLELGLILEVLLSFVGDIGIPLKLHQGAWDSFLVVFQTSGFLLSCNRKLRVPLEFHQGSWASSQVEVGISGFL